MAKKPGARLTLKDRQQREEVMQKIGHRLRLLHTTETYQEIAIRLQSRPGRFEKHATRSLANLLSRVASGGHMNKASGAYTLSQPAAEEFLSLLEALPPTTGLTPRERGLKLQASLSRPSNNPKACEDFAWIQKKLEACVRSGSHVKVIAAWLHEAGVQVHQSKLSRILHDGAARTDRVDCFNVSPELAGRIRAVLEQRELPNPSTPHKVVVHPTTRGNRRHFVTAK